MLILHLEVSLHSQPIIQLLGCSLEPEKKTKNCILITCDLQINFKVLVKIEKLLSLY